MQYAAILNAVKTIIFDAKNVIFFLIFAQNIDCGYTLESHQLCGHNLCFRAKIRKLFTLFSFVEVVVNKSNLIC